MTDNPGDKMAECVFNRADVLGQAEELAADGILDLSRLLPEQLSPDAFNVPRDRPLWVFGYGSLMWDPGFPHGAVRRGLLRGYHRRFCVLSRRYRGTTEAPGLVLGLDRGGSCRGLVFRADPPDVDPVLDYLWQREMNSKVYRPKLLTIDTPDGPVNACCFVVDRSHPHYCGAMSRTEVRTRIARCEGMRGPNIEYLVNTVEHLDQIGVPDRGLKRLLSEIRKGEVHDPDDGKAA